MPQGKNENVELFSPIQSEDGTQYEFFLKYKK